MKERVNEQITNPKTRIYYLDVARFIAIISISCNHAVNRGYATYVNQYIEFNSLPIYSSLFETIIYIFSRMGVPLFLMISGALLLKKDINDQKGIVAFYKHNLLRLFLTSEIWIVICFWFLAIQRIIADPSVLLKTIRDFLLSMLFINQEVYPSFWYLPMILCLYILIPFLCILKNHISWKSIIIPFFIVIFIGFVVPSINSFNLYFFDGNKWNLPDRAFLLSYFLVYMVIGYFISKKKLKSIATKWIALLFIISFGVTCAFQYYAFSQKPDCHLTYDFIGVLVASTFLFELIRRFADKVIVIRKPVEYIAKISFGIYFVHIFVMSILDHFGYLFSSFFNKPMYVLFLEFASVGLSILIIFITSKISFVKKYLYMM